MGLAGVEDAGPRGHSEVIDDGTAAGDELAAAVSQFGIVDVLVGPGVRHGRPAVGGKRQLVLPEVSAAAVGLDELFYLCLGHDLAGLFDPLHRRTGGSLNDRGVGIGVGIVLFQLFFDQLHDGLHLRGDGDADVGVVAHRQQGSQLDLEIAARAGGRDLDAPFILYDHEQRLVRVAVQPAVDAHLMADIGRLSAGDLDADPPGRLAVVLHGVDAEDGHLVGLATEGDGFREVGVAGLGACQRTGDGECAAGDGLRQQGSACAGIRGFFPAHIVIPPILMVMVSRVLASPLPAKADALTSLGLMVPGRATVA